MIKPKKKQKLFLDLSFEIKDKTTLIKRMQGLSKRFLNWYFQETKSKNKIKM